MVSTRVAMDTRGAAPGAWRVSSALPTSPTLAQAGELRAGPRAEEGRLLADPSAGSRRGFRRRARKAKLFRSATRKRQRPPGGHFLPPRPTALSLTRRSRLSPPLVSANELRTRVPGPRLLTLDARVYFTQL